VHLAGDDPVPAPRALITPHITQQALRGHDHPAGPLAAALSRSSSSTRCMQPMASSGGGSGLRWRRPAGSVASIRRPWWTPNLTQCERPRPADDVFVYPGCPQPVPSRSPSPGPGSAQAARAPSSTGRAARRRGHGGIAGSRSFAAIGQWAADAGPQVLTVLGAARGPAEESTFRRAFALVSGDVLDRVLGAWLWTRAVQAGGRLVIAVDGKALRGAKGKDRNAPHLVAAPAHGIGAVLGQVAVDEKSNEIPAVRELSCCVCIASIVRTAPARSANAFSHQHPAPGRPHEHRRRQPPSRPRPAADTQATPSCMNTLCRVPGELRPGTAAVDKYVDSIMA
jgi:hypothetical protein